MSTLYRQMIWCTTLVNSNQSWVKSFQFICWCFMFLLKCIIFGAFEIISGPRANWLDEESFSQIFMRLWTNFSTFILFIHILVYTTRRSPYRMYIQSSINNISECWNVKKMMLNFWTRTWLEINSLTCPKDNYGVFYVTFSSCVSLLLKELPWPQFQIGRPRWSY